MDENKLYQIINNLSIYILGENRKLHEEIKDIKNIIKFIENNLPSKYHLCTECYIPTKDNCECFAYNLGYNHCDNCCGWDYIVDEEESEGESEPIMKINIEKIDFEDYNDGDPDFIKRNKARRYGYAIFYCSYDNKWYKINIQDWDKIHGKKIHDVSSVNVQIKFNYIIINYHYFISLLTDSPTIIIPDDYYNLLDIINE